MSEMKKSSASNEVQPVFFVLFVFFGFLAAVVTFFRSPCEGQAKTFLFRCCSRSAVRAFD